MLASDLKLITRASSPQAPWTVTSDRRRAVTFGIAAVLLSLLAALLVLALQFVSVVVVATWIGVIAIAWRPRIGLLVAFALVLLFEAGNADMLMLPGSYLLGGLSGTLGLPVIASPLELLLLLTFAAWLAEMIVTQRVDVRLGRLGWPMMLFFVALVAGLLRGILSGGDLNVALWESRFLFYSVICYLIAANTIRTRRHLTTLLAVAILASTLFAVEGAYRRLALIDTGKINVIPEFAFSHESTIFLGTLIVFGIGLWSFRAPTWMRILATPAVAVGLYTLLATERRAGSIALFAAFAIVAIMLFVSHRRAFMLVALPVLVGTAIYLPLFWNNTSLVGQPARAVRSMYQPDARDAASNSYRDIEKINVQATIHSDPLLGVGFGRQFLFVAPLPDISWWPFWRYEPHHNIQWVWLKTGVAGFALFWVLIGSALALASNAVRNLREPPQQAFAVFAVAGIVCTLVFSYVDLGLVSGRVTVFLGTILGTVSVLDQLEA